MGWLKNREKLHEAAISSIKAISKNKDLSSKNGIAQRPPSKNQASISSTPRSSKDLSSWRGESDSKLFGIYIIEITKKLPLPFQREWFSTNLKCLELKYWVQMNIKVLKKILLNTWKLKVSIWMMKSLQIF